MYDHDYCYECSGYGMIITLTMMGSYNAGAKRARSAAGGMKISV